MKTRIILVHIIQWFATDITYPFFQTFANTIKIMFIFFYLSFIHLLDEFRS